jgi:uroporphyrinogen-III synthase
MRVALFRAQDDGERTADRLRALGHEPVLAPVIEIVPTGATIPRAAFDGYVFTSGRAIEALRPDQHVELRGWPCFCVGTRTAAVASKAGLADIRVGSGDAEDLAALIGATLPLGARLLFLAGRDRKDTIERQLGGSGYRVDVAEVYEAKPVSSWSGPVREAFGRNEVGAALHFSRRSADLALHLATVAGVLQPLLAAAHHCLSQDASVPLAAFGVARIVVAERPSEDSLLAGLSRPV